MTTLFNATVIFPAGKIFENQYGKSQSAKVLLESGENVDIWEKPNGIIAKWMKGDKVAVTINSRGKYEAILNYGESVAQSAPIAANVTPQAATPQAHSQTPTAAKSIKPSAEVQYQIVEYQEFCAKVYHMAFTKANEQMVDLMLKDEQLKDIASCIFIQTMRRFSL
jgi:hypothetical protein